MRLILDEEKLLCSGNTMALKDGRNISFRISTYTRVSLSDGCSFLVFAWISWWWCACVSGECALHLPRGGAPTSSSLSHHLLNDVLLAASPASVCITYSDIEKALFATSSKIAVTQPEGEWTPDDLAPVGELLLETSRIIALQHGLTASEVAHYLPQVDMMKTSVASICPAFASPTLCTPGKYRRIDGLCNNVHHPTWGATRSVFQRFLPAAYSDGISAPRQSSARGASLPSPRLVSAMVHRDEGFHDHAATLMLIAWGQLMDHDFTLTAMSLDPVSRNEPQGCCAPPAGLKNPYCLEIDVPHDDRFFGLFRFRCIDFVRGFPGVPQNCRLGQRNQINILTGVIDGNTVYGGTDEEARALRMGVGGLLRHYDHFPGTDMKELLPLKTDIPDEGCIRENGSQLCFLAGEIRVNEQLILTCMHTLLMREHNRVASRLSRLNPHWDDEALYQETRRIVAAIIQHITFNEFLPQLLGRNVMEQYDLILTKKGYWDGYDPSADPSISASFAAAAFRFGHSLLPSSVERWSPSHKFIASKRLHKLIRQPFDLFRAGVLDEYFLGMLNQPAQAMDDSITQEVTHHLFAEPGERHGLDLVSFNVQRGREVGIPGYGAWRFTMTNGNPDAFYVPTWAILKVLRFKFGLVNVLPVCFT
ncbi:chorion peroxidase-like [Penaeus indicus]|uniref:chorion peroxidase-like n=1 Tax=Penaeus indicus TaxID=29960 RepID=UPI00300C9490